MAQLWSCPSGLVTAGRGAAGCAGGGRAGGARAWPAGEVLVEVFFYLGCLGPAFECLEVLFSRCFLAHAGSVYKQRLKAEPLGSLQLLARGAVGPQAGAGSPGPKLLRCQGPGVTAGKEFSPPFERGHGQPGG